ncbi:hypothetical protein NDU88_007990 [Pleurodeles waltl]|uniref:Uncharacterized protein n=1 Tax=Pleurodeles waltl TaxID=8319 RepID=A0AAV7N7W1_PLEWA|nr:hypothetical protein NDU88_007990 [Pleurodeles waltl]
MPRDLRKQLIKKDIKTLSYLADTARPTEYDNFKYTIETRGVAWRHGGSSFFFRLPPFSPRLRGYNNQFSSRFRTEAAECMVTPRTTDDRLLTPKNCRLGSDTNGLDANRKKTRGDKMAAAMHSETWAAGKIP